MTYVQEILQKHPDAANWQLQYPWFAIGQMVAAAQNKAIARQETANQRAAVFIGNISRLHWLLNQQDWDKDVVTTQANTEVTASPPVENSISQTFESNPQFTIDLSGPPDEEEPTEEMAENDTAHPSLSGSLQEAANTFRNGVATDDALLFETAYQHTIDYFASQGIQLEGEPAQDDRFGQQLKTFTSWLRQMKRLPNTPEVDSDTLVVNQAAHSLQKGDVLTESMVDVLVKQGKRNQALQVLEKLRLLHPEKSLYFAARSEQIKHSK